ncbi:MAG: hypothetical protein OXI26_11270 [bacterium]|nr:hypothetical protein [bacterium]
MAAGSAVAGMVAVGWYPVVANDGQVPGGDMIGHAAAAEWLRTLPWWDWRGWSGWFFGGQAIGVNYPPLGHAWMRFTHPVHGQMVAVLVGLVVLLPWGALSLSRSIGYSPRAQRAAVGAVLLLAALAGNMHWVLSGFHYVHTFYGSWPAMVASVLGLFCASRAARCHKPLTCGVIGGISLLVNSTVAPGIAVVCLALLVSSGASFRRGILWSAKAALAGLAVAGWWLVPFVAGWDRLVRWEVPFSASWDFGGVWQAVVVAVLGVGTAWSARRSAGPARRLALAAAAALVATLLGDLFGYLRPERWLQTALLVAAVATAELVEAVPRSADVRPVRPAWAVLAVPAVIVFVVVAGRLEAIPLAAWLLWWPNRSWAIAGALAWASALVWVPFWDPRGDAEEPVDYKDPFQAVAAESRPADDGLVYADLTYTTASGRLAACAEERPWRTTHETGGRIRPLGGLYIETSHAAEFLLAEYGLQNGRFEGYRAQRSHWSDEWDALGRPALDPHRVAEALGARWLAACGPDNTVSIADLPGTSASGASVVSYPDQDSWHRAAVGWWLPLVSDDSPIPSVRTAHAGSPEEPNTGIEERSAGGPESSVPILASAVSASHPEDQPATGVALSSSGDEMTVRAETPGWVWIRVPWDPDWRSVSGTPVRKGGPGHLVVWAQEGETELRWSVRSGVNIAAGTVTGLGVLGLAALQALGGRGVRGSRPGRDRPAARSLEIFADTIDHWVGTVTAWVRGMISTDPSRDAG